MTKNYRIASLILLIICGGLLFMPLESNVGQELTGMLKVTLSVYAVLRGLNAVISTAQGTELSIEPMGVGVTLTPGQILDPLNDLIEQVSTVLLFASASIGIQKILLSLTDIELLRWGLLLLAVAVIVVIASKKLAIKHQQSLIRLVVVVTVLRLMIPCMALTSGLMQSWLETQREESVTTLITAQNDIEELNQSTTETQTEKASWFDSMTSKLHLNDLFSSVEHKADNAVNAAVYLLAEFVLVFILIPMLFLFISYRILIRQFSSNTTD